MLDNNLLFEPAVGTAVTVSADSTNTLDFLSLRDVGVGDTLEIHVNVLQTFTAAGAGTLQISLRASPDNATFYDILDSPTYALANLIAGQPLFRYTWPVNQPLEGGVAGESQVNPVGSPGRYYKLRYTVGTGPMTAGKVTAFVTGGRDRAVYHTYPRGYAIGA